MRHDWEIVPGGRIEWKRCRVCGATKPSGAKDEAWGVMRCKGVLEPQGEPEPPK